MALGLVVVLIVAAAAGFYYVTQQGGTSVTSGPSTSSTTSKSTTTGEGFNLRSVFESHLANIGSRNIPVALLDYYDNAVVTWSGNTAGLGGIYNGTGNIRLLFAAALATAQTMSVKSLDFRQINNSVSQETVNSTLDFNGKSSILGKFDGTIKSETIYTNPGGTWSIFKENWNYLVFNASSAGGATTFPEWQKIGPINPTLRSPDPVHNFVWDYGGFAAALVLYAFVIVLAFLLVLRRSKPK